MDRAVPARGDGGPLAVGVFEEPELIVSGVHGMLARSGTPTRVLHLAQDDPRAQVDVVLCDPIGRSAQIEDYLAVVGALTPAPVLVFSWSNSRSSLRRALAAGARGFVSKAASAADLTAAVSVVQRGGTVAPTARLSTPHGVGGLSKREAEVLELICCGLSNLEIAEHLFVSVNSVKTHVRQVYQKIGVGRRAQAVAWGLAHGF